MNIVRIISTLEFESFESKQLLIRALANLTFDNSINRKEILKHNLLERLLDYLNVDKLATLVCKSLNNIAMDDKNVCVYLLQNQILDKLSLCDSTSTSNLLTLLLENGNYL